MTKMAPTRSTKARTKTAVKRSVTSRKSTTKATLRRQRKWHVRLSLHPVSILIALCVGVLLVAATMSSYGDSFTVNATVPAAVLKSAAIIESPATQTRVNTPMVSVTGTCPNSSYVTVTANSSVAGVSSCDSNGNFQVATSLQTGSNVISAQDYTVTNQAGPTSASVTVTYEPPAVNTAAAITPVAAPVTLVATQDDTSVAYDPSIIQATSQLPTFQGLAPPYSQITLLVHSNPVLCQTVANGIGYWSCTINTVLPVGEHTVYISAKTLEGQTLTLPAFHIQAQVKAAIRPILTPMDLTTSYEYRAYLLDHAVPINFTLAGGASPFAWTINWGDGTTTTIVKSADGVISLSHVYKLLHASIGTFTIKAQAIDATGKTVTAQLIAVVRNPAFASPGFTSGIQATGIWQHIISFVHSWRWLLWPGYLIVLLMIISFWLGERNQWLSDRKVLVNRRRRTKAQRHA